MWKKYLLLLVVFQTDLSFAGTYNFYFNNTEQGANSKADPSLIVKDGDSGAEVTKNIDQETASVPVVPQNKIETAYDSQNDAKESDPNNFRFSAGMSSHELKGERHKGVFDSDPYDPLPFWKQKESIWKRGSGASIEFTWFLAPAFGMGIFVGPVIGASLEVQPFASFSWALQPLLEIGLGKPNLGTDDDLNDETKTLLFLGGGGELRFSKSFGLIAVAKFGGASADSTYFRQLYAGLTYRF